MGRGRLGRGGLDRGALAWTRGAPGPGQRCKAHRGLGGPAPGAGEGAAASVSLRRPPQPASCPHSALPAVAGPDARPLPGKHVCAPRHAFTHTRAHTRSHTPSITDECSPPHVARRLCPPRRPPVCQEHVQVLAGPPVPRLPAAGLSPRRPLKCLAGAWDPLNGRGRDRVLRAGTTWPCFRASPADPPIYSTARRAVGRPPLEVPSVVLLCHGPPAFALSLLPTGPGVTQLPIHAVYQKPSPSQHREQSGAWGIEWVGETEGGPTGQRPRHPPIARAEDTGCGGHRQPSVPRAPPSAPLPSPGQTSSQHPSAAMAQTEDSA